jgi:ferric-dicitrate binding protein FerR (iron transport regulator)
MAAVVKDEVIAAKEASLLAATEHAEAWRELAAEWQQLAGTSTAQHKAALQARARCGDAHPATLEETRKDAEVRGLLVIWTNLVPAPVLAITGVQECVSSGLVIPA